jgi:hypothetical protein
MIQHQHRKQPTAGTINECVRTKAYRVMLACKECRAIWYGRIKRNPQGTCDCPICGERTTPAILNGLNKWV